MNYFHSNFSIFKTFLKGKHYGDENIVDSLYYFSNLKIFNRTRFPCIISVRLSKNRESYIAKKP